MDRSTLRAIIADPLTAAATRASLIRQLAAIGAEPQAAEAAPRLTGTAALAAVRKPGVMTTTERRYADWLDQQKTAGSILAWDYECDRLRLAEKIDGGREKWFKIDFTVTHADGHVSWDETKGSWCSQTGIERWRWLCQKYPSRHFRLWMWAHGEWRLKSESGKPIAIIS